MEEFSKYKFKALSWILPALIFSLTCIFGVLPIAKQTQTLKEGMTQKDRLSYTGPWLDSVNIQQSGMIKKSGSLLETFEKRLSQERSSDPIAKTIRKLFTFSEMDVSRVTSKESAIGNIHRVNVRISGTCNFSALNKVLKVLYSAPIYYEIAQMTLRKKKTKLSYAITIHAYNKLAGKSLDLKTTR